MDSTYIFTTWGTRSGRASVGGRRVLKEAHEPAVERADQLPYASSDYLLPPVDSPSGTGASHQ
jgi:hypothetical protein